MQATFRCDRQHIFFSVKKKSKMNIALCERLIHLDRKRIARDMRQIENRLKNFLRNKEMSEALYNDLSVLHYDFMQMIKGLENSIEPHPTPRQILDDLLVEILMNLRNNDGIIQSEGNRSDGEAL